VKFSNIVHDIVSIPVLDPKFVIVIGQGQVTISRGDCFHVSGMTCLYIALVVTYINTLLRLQAKLPGSKQ
jgi:hypothetical protein